MKVLLTFFTLFGLTSASFAQRSAAGLRDLAFQKEIQTYFSKFDSLILADKANERMDDLCLKGFGFCRNKVYYISIQLSQTDTEPYTVHIAAVSKHKLKGTIVPHLLEKMNFSSMNTWNSDSLQAKAKPGEQAYTFTGGSSYSLLFIDNVKAQSTLKQSQSPLNYQKMYATKDRADFINVFDSLTCLIEAY